MSSVKNWLRLLRPHQWLKNAFVLVGVLFGHAWNDGGLLLQAAWAFVAFSLLASAVYVLNDLIDREQDRLHPVKCRRPLASGAVSTQAALGLLAACLVAGFAVVYLAGSQAAWVYVAYVLLNLGYTLGLKHVVVLDVFIIAAGFMLRILAGTIGIGITPSYWLLLCSLMLTLFLGFAKRQAEFMALADEEASAHRRVLEQYSPAMLDQFMTIACAGAIIAYGLYTVNPETIALHDTRDLVYTVPVVSYGMFRYLFLLHRRGGGGDPARLILSDRHLRITALSWVALVVAIFQGWL